MTWVRWEWAFARGIQDQMTYETVGLWVMDDEIVGAALYEEQPGRAWLIADPAHEAIKPEMLAYAQSHLQKDGQLLVSIDDNGGRLQQAAWARGFKPTQGKEQTAELEISYANTRYTLPVGFSITSLKDTFDLKKYNRALWAGFNHDGPAPDDEKSIEWRKNCLTSPHANLDLHIAVVAPNGEFAAYAGVWFYAGTDYAVIEPLATHPEYRKMGLGKAAALEAIWRAGQLGAKTALVGSSQQFYYNIGFAPRSNETFWVKQEK